MEVKLTFFKESGKYYTEGKYHTNIDSQYMWMIYEEVRAFNVVGILPELATGRWNGYVLVSPVEGVPALLDFTEIDVK